MSISGATLKMHVIIIRETHNMPENGILKSQPYGHSDCISDSENYDLNSLERTFAGSSTIERLSERDLDEHSNESYCTLFI